MENTGMKQGMLWYDSRMGADIRSQVKRAVEYFTAKYGQPPTRCYIHPDMLTPDLPTPSGIQIVTSTRVLRNHIWIEFPLAD
jgi:hypothetical protein